MKLRAAFRVVQIVTTKVLPARWGGAQWIYRLYSQATGVINQAFCSGDFSLADLAVLPDEMVRTRWSGVWVGVCPHCSMRRVYWFAGFSSPSFCRCSMCGSEYPASVFGGA